MLRARLVFASALLLLAGIAVGGAEDPEWDATVAVGQSIQAIIDGAPDGGVVHLDEGTWEGHLIVRKDLTLLGVPGSTVLQGCDGDSPVICIETPAEDEVFVALVGLTIMGGAGWNGPGLLVKGAARVTLSDSIVRNNENYGVHLQGSSQVVVAHSTIQHNGSVAIFVSDSAQVHVVCSTISENASHAIYAEGSPRAVLAQSTLSRNGGYGVYARLSSRIVISGSVIEENAYGAVIEQRACATAVDATIRGNLHGGILLGSSARLILEGSRILRNGDCGVALREQPCRDSTDAFTGFVSGRANAIAAPGEEDGNRLCAVCPEGLAFLTSEDGGELDRSEPED